MVATGAQGATQTFSSPGSHSFQWRPGVVEQLAPQGLMEALDLATAAVKQVLRPGT